MRFGSLFSGIGGFDLGFERAGMACVWQVEIDKDCQRVLRKQFANAERYEDVSTVGKLPTVDVICGGFPCQDLSVAGKRAGLAGERSGLWFQFLRIIESNLPRWIVVENVPGLLSSDEGRDFAAILRGLVECGYCLAWRIFDAQYDGVAQRRRRVFIVGSLGDGSCAEILFESESVSWNPPTRGEAGAGVANSISGGAHPGGHNGQDDMSVIAMPLKSKANSSHDESHETYIPGYIHPRQMRGSESSNQVGIKPDADVTDSLTQEGPGAVMVPQVTHALRSEGTDASEDGTGRGTPLIATPITSSFARHHGRTAGNNGGADNLVVTDLEHDRFHCLTCGQWFCVNDYESNTVTCPKCGETHIDKITDVLDARAVDVRNLRMQPDGTSGTLQHKKSGGYSLNYQNPVMAFDERNITSRENRSNPKPGDPCHTLHADPPTLVAFSSKDHGADAGEISPTLRAQNSKDSHQNGGGHGARGGRAATPAAEVSSGPIGWTTNQAARGAFLRLRRGPTFSGCARRGCCGG